VRRLLPVTVAALVLATVPAYAHHDNGKGRGHQGPHPTKPQPVATSPCTGDPASVRLAVTTVQGQQALALYALPSRKPRGIVVFDHGYGHTMYSWEKHVARTAAELGVIAIAPNYRGQVDDLRTQPLPSSRGWRVAEGAQDSIAFAREFEKRCKPTGLNVIYGVSMGGNTSGLALAELGEARAAETRPSEPLFDYWVNIEGAANVTETYLGARALAVSGNSTAVNAVQDIEAAFGGPLESASATYADRTVVNRVGDIVDSGVKGVVMVHGVADGLVTHDHSRQLQGLLLDAGTPVDMTSFVTRSATSEPGTTVDGYLPTGQTSPFAGHASEASMTHDVGRRGFAALAALYRDGKVACSETLVDGTTGADRTTTVSC
jgi:hypothetical protein